LTKTNLFSAQAGSSDPAFFARIDGAGGPAELLNNLAWLLATDPDPHIRDGHKAAKLAEKACEASKGTNSAMLSTLAAAYAEAGLFVQAVQAQEKVCNMVQGSGREPEANARARLELYKSHKNLLNAASRTARP
jgi:hypothetical protein